MLKYKPIIFSLLSALSFCTIAAEKPNILIILADDMGYSDLGCIGGEIKTPNLDKLANEGLLFTNFYNNGKCAPTRASLMTGLSNHKTGATHASGNIEKYGGLCLAEALEKNYVNLMVDKWHISPKPLEMEFKRYFGSPISAVYWWPVSEKTAGKMRLDGEQYTPDDMKVPLEEWYLTTEDTRYAIQFIEDEIVRKKSKKPFFMYYATHASHWPLQARREDVKLFEDKLKDGTDVVRERRYKHMVEKGIIDPKTCKLNPAEQKWADLPEDRKAYYRPALAVHYALVYRMDLELGRFFDYLKKNNLWENTLIFFMADNGASAEGNPTIIPKGGLLGDRGTRARIDNIGAQMCNTPFKGNKSTLYEGGECTPMIVHWPAGIGKPGNMVRQVGHIIDIVPTILDVAGIKYPTKYKDRDILPLDGVSLLPVIKGGKEFKRGFVQHYEKFDLVRDGDWKAIRKNSRNSGEKALWELYNLKSDRSEQKNVAAENPERVHNMEKVYNEWKAEIKAICEKAIAKYPELDPAVKAKKKKKVRPKTRQRKNDTKPRKTARRNSLRAKREYHTWAELCRNT